MSSANVNAHASLEVKEDGKVSQMSTAMQNLTLVATDRRMIQAERFAHVLRDVEALDTVQSIPTLSKHGVVQVSNGGLGYQIWYPPT